MKTILVIFAIVSVYNVQADDTIRAIAVLRGGTIEGNVTFTQNGCGQPVIIGVSISGLSQVGHGFHVHETGDLSDGCISLLAHYNPDSLNHGGPEDEIRHLGDLGNIHADASGLAQTVFSDNEISLSGSRSVIGRGLIVHQNIDDLGRGGHPDSLETGNAGPRIACAVIGYLDANPIQPCSSANIISSILVPFVTLIVILLQRN